MYNRKRSGKSLAVLVILAVLILILDVILVEIYVLRNHAGVAESANSTVQSIINEILPKIDKNQESRESAEQKAAERAAAEAEPGIVITGKPEIEAKAGETLIRGINLENDEENKDLYYMTYELRLPDNSAHGYEELFVTDLIEPGNVIADVELTRPLEAGEYECILHVQPYYMDTLLQTNNADLITKLVVK